MNLAIQQMEAAVLYGKEELRIETVAVPKISAGDLLVRVSAALTCGTDVKVFRRGYHARMIRPPALFGHELAGDVVQVGAGVKGFQIGMRIVAANSAPCSKCFPSLSSRRMLHIRLGLIFSISRAMVSNTLLKGALAVNNSST